MKKFFVGIVVMCAHALGAQTVVGDTAWTRVTYLSGRTVYLEVGSTNGVSVGTGLDIVRRGVAVVRLTAEFVSSTRAACTRDNPGVALAVGDSVRYVAVAPPESTPAATHAFGAQTIGTGVRTRAPWMSAIRGRVGVRYLMMDAGASAGTMSQPAFDVRLDGQHVANSPFGLAVDVRAQRSVFNAPASSGQSPSPTSLTRVYQAAVQYAPNASPLRVTAGRQFATALSTLGMFDGVAVDVDRPHMSYGGLVGVEPDPATLGVSTATREYGAYVQWHNKPAMLPLWSVTLGGVGAYRLGNIDREFGYLRATFNNRRWSVFAAQEFDLNRGWKSGEEHASVTPTSTFAIAQMSVSNAVSVHAGMDNRRNARLYRDYQNPETVFDDSFRQGMWGGINLSALRRVRASFDVRTSAGGSVGDADSYTGSVSVNRITRMQGAVHARATRFTGRASSGSLQSASVEFHPLRAIRVEYTAGTRVSSHPIDLTNATRMRWTQLDADVGIGRSLYFMLSTSREAGAGNRTALTYASLSYRF